MPPTLSVSSPENVHPDVEKQLIFVSILSLDAWNAYYAFLNMFCHFKLYFLANLVFALE